jgi:Ca2+-binding EF-hand superfamily protein
MSISAISTGSFDPTTLFQNIFKKVDSDSSGGIDKTEFKSAVEKMTNNDDLSSNELDAMFTKLDTNSDGKVDETEMLAALKSSGDARQAQMQAMGNMPPPPPPPDNSNSSQSKSLTDDQKKTVDSILSKYDTSNLTADNVKAINQAISDAGISFNKALGDEIESQGFSIKTMMSLSPPPTSSDSNSTSSAAASSSSDSKESVSFAKLIKFLQSSDNNGEDTAFSDLINSLKSSTSSDDDAITSIFNSLVQDLMNSTNYSQLGSLSGNTATTQSLLSLYA